MFLPLLLAFAMSPSEWVPARWNWTEPATLGLLDGTPINCLLVPWDDARQSATAEFAAQAARRGVATLAVLTPNSAQPAAPARRAIDSQLAGVVLEGDFPAGTAMRVRDALAGTKAVVIELPSRSRMNLAEPVPIMGTWQGVWAGIQVLDNGAAKAAPSGGVWIDTNAGFLRAVRAWGPAVIWLANLPPPKTVQRPERYLQMIGDTAAAGGRWVVALDDDFAARLRQGDAKARQSWGRIGQHLRFWEDHSSWRSLDAFGQLAVVQDAGGDSLLSGGILDMIAVKHTPVRAVPRPKLAPDRLRGATLAVNVDPEGMTPAERDVLRGFARGGGTLLSSPPGWKSNRARAGDAITFDKDELERIESIWKEVNALIGRRNLGARLFNVSTVLSNIVASPDGKQVIVQLVNYSEYPVESVTAHLLGEFTKAALLTPEHGEKIVEIYKAEEGSGVDLDRIETVAALRLTR